MQYFGIFLSIIHGCCSDFAGSLMEQFISGLVYERHCSSPRINFIHDVPGVGAGMHVPVG